MKTLIPKKIIIEINDLSQMTAVTLLYQMNIDGVIAPQFSSSSVLSAIGDFNINSLIANAVDFAKRSESI